MPSLMSCAHTEVTPKDRARIATLIHRFGHDDTALMRHAAAMASRITDPAKAIRRARAAESENFHTMACVFYRRHAVLAGC